MKLEFKLKAKVRDETGKRAAKQIRNEGGIPGIMYGSGVEPKKLLVGSDELQEILRGEAGINALITLDVVEDEKDKERDSHLVLIKEIQRHPLKEKILHVDFLAVARDEEVTMKIPLAVMGEDESPALKAGGTLQHNLWDVEVKCLPQNAPHHLFVDVSQANIGDHFRVSDLECPDGVEVLTEEEDIVLSILAPRLVAAEAGAEAAEGEAVAEEAAEEKAEEPTAEGED